MRQRVGLRQEDFECVSIEKRGNGVAYVRLLGRGPDDRHNAIGDILHHELVDLPLAIQEDHDVRCVVLAGKGGNFSSGGDISPDRTRTPPRATQWDSYLVQGFEIVKRFVELDKPVITAVRGYALGLGCVLALMGDIVVADHSAMFGDPHVWNIGVTAGDGNAALLPLLIGIQQAKYYLLTGEYIPADEAHKLGLVTRLVDRSDLDSEVARIADRIASGPPLAIRSTKAAVQRYVDLIVRTVIPFSLAAEGLISHSDDSGEARSAWAQRRTPVFTGLDARARGGVSPPGGATCG